jgi:AcrR family transcriptional regulator
MAAQTVTVDRLLDAAEDALRRYGPAKTAVVDVARALGVSHGTVYRYFPSKAALRDAVLERWLGRMDPPLRAIATADGAAGPRLRAWLLELAERKQTRAREDPDLFAAYALMAEEARDVVARHLEGLLAQVTRIVADGMAAGEFAPGDARTTAGAVLDAMSCFHHPAHVARWNAPDRGDAFEAVWQLVWQGLAAR